AQPVGELTTNGHQQSLAQFLRKAGKRTLREAIISYTSGGASVDLVGTPDSVAARMGEVMEEVGGDGFLFSMPNVSRRLLAEIEDGLVPALQDRAWFVPLTATLSSATICWNFSGARRSSGVSANARDTRRVREIVP